MVDLDASFFHHLLKLAVADRSDGHIPTETPKDDLPLKMTALEIDHREALRCQTDHDHSPTGLPAQLCDRTVLFAGELTFMVGTGQLRCRSEFATEPFPVLL